MVGVCGKRRAAVVCRRRVVWHDDTENGARPRTARMDLPLEKNSCRFFPPLLQFPLRTTLRVDDGQGRSAAAAKWLC
jgi:hypothetical protein